MNNNSEIAVFNCVEETCRYVTRSSLPFGGKVIVLLGDFRQTCPVIQNGSRQQVVDACIKSSPLWSLFQQTTLTRLIRNAEDPNFAAFVNNIGDGAGPNVPFNGLRTVETVQDVVDFVFPPNMLSAPVSNSQRAILAPTNAQIDVYTV